MMREELDLRRTPYADKYLLIFPNQMIKMWYQEYLKRDDIIYKTESELENNGLVGMRYLNWLYVYEGTIKRDVERLMPRIIHKGDSND
jgi:hypothetical protein